jgi:hypothetical protein
MIKKIAIAVLGLLLAAFVLYSCEKEQTTLPTEPIKEIDGTWKIVSALRNGTDMTNRFDFSRFRITFSGNAYTVTNPVPFIQEGAGTWTFDDPGYPFKMNFQENGGAAKSSEIQYPVRNGKRNIVISFSPGCAANTYQYTLEKEN